MLNLALGLFGICYLGFISFCIPSL